MYSSRPIYHAAFATRATINKYGSNDDKDGIKKGIKEYTKPEVNGS